MSNVVVGESYYENNLNYNIVRTRYLLKIKTGKEEIESILFTTMVGNDKTVMTTDEFLRNYTLLEVKPNRK